MSFEPGILARGPWPLERVSAYWRKDRYQPAADVDAAADAEIERLRLRGSPSHDGVATRLSGFSLREGELVLELQPIRWALRLLPSDAMQSVAALCVTRAADGRWLAGRRAQWVSSWPGRWALGAGGAVDEGENPTQTLVRELHEEWSVVPERVQAEALICLPSRLVLFIGSAWLPEGAEVVPDHEHDEFAWWPADVTRWPAQADTALRRMATLLS